MNRIEKTNKSIAERDRAIAINAMTLKQRAGLGQNLHAMIDAAQVRYNGRLVQCNEAGHEYRLVLHKDGIEYAHAPYSVVYVSMVPASIYSLTPGADQIWFSKAIHNLTWPKTRQA